MPGPIRCVTVASHDAVSAASAYVEYLDYRVLAQREVSAELASAWNAPDMSGRPQVLLAPRHVPDRYLRFVEIDSVESYAPLMTQGWNAIELIARDTDAMARRLEDSPFEIVGPPEDLSFSDAIRAMQAIGPGGAMVYLTMSKRKIEEFDLPDVKGEVGEPFIVIAGGELEAMKAFYKDKAGLPDAPVFDGKITVLSNAYGLPADTPQRLAAMPLGGSFYIELDQYPVAATPRTRTEGQLPPGQSMVSFDVADLSALPLAWRSEPVAVSEPPYDGRRIAVAEGAAGEWIELWESVAPA